MAVFCAVSSLGIGTAAAQERPPEAAEHRSRATADAQRPFVTARARTLPRRAVRIEAGASFTSGTRLPLSGLGGDLLTARGGLAVGLADGVEARLEGVGWQHLSIEEADDTAPLAQALELEGDGTRDAADPALALRVRLGRAAEAPLQTGVQVGVGLPVAGNESGLGRDVTDASAALLVAWRRGDLDVGAEAAFLILGSPIRAGEQDDQGRIGLVAELAAVPDRLVVGGEVRTSFGDEDVGNEILTELAFGSRARLGAFWADAAYRRARA
ncbi:MAG: hypothetical protein ABR599_01150 [Gemmatimonadota bacterium]